MRKVLLILVAGGALALAACEDDDTYKVPDTNDVVIVDEDADNGVGCDDPATPDVIEACP